LVIPAAARHALGLLPGDVLSVRVEEDHLVLDGAAVPAVNWSEVLQKAATRDIDTDGLGEEVDALGVRVMAFDRDAAEETARLWPLTTDAGLSLAERACLALAAALGATAVTTDRAWAHINVGVSVQVIR
jgi:PIN domain nuclease of toxin-antitoxin system